MRRPAGGRLEPEPQVAFVCGGARSVFHIQASGSGVEVRSDELVARFDRMQTHTRGAVTYPTANLLRETQGTIGAMSKRAFMRVELGASAPHDGPDVRTFEPDDVHALGDLMLRAYLDTVDYEGETAEEAAAEILKTIQGGYGEFIPTCSKVVARAGSLLSATLVTRLRGTPLVAFTFTDPAFSGQGLARACMQAAMSALFKEGDRQLRLVVTLANTPAVRLYTRLGFQFEQA